MINKIIVVIILCLGLSALGQENLIYQQIQNERLNGEKFAPVHGVFKQDKLDPVVAKEFKNSKEVSFFQFDAKAISHKERSFSLDLPLNNTIMTLELVAVDDSFYDYVVTTDKGKTFSANRDIKHYRGVIKGDKSSLVAISFFGDEVGGIIATDEGNFNLEIVNKYKGIIFYKDTNLVKQPISECGIDDTMDKDKGIYDPNILLQESKLAISGLSNKCIRMYFETEYDMFQVKGSVFAVEYHVATIFNQVALLYKNENLNIKISEIKVWTSEDPYISTDTEMLLPEFRDKISAYDGDLAQLLTYRSIGGGRAEFDAFDKLPKERVSVAELHTSEFLNTIYSWNVMVIAHEFGHSLSSRHTHACRWNGNNTAIDHCGSYYYYSIGRVPSEIEGFNCLNIQNPIAPLNGGTIMSYCHLQSVGINLNKGFGIQPGNKIRNYVANARVLNSCDYSFCPSDLLLYSNEPSVPYDLKHVSNRIVAKNTILSENRGIYLGKSILLDPGFKVEAGASFIARVDPCISPTSYVVAGNSYQDEAPDTILETSFLEIQLYPNPTFSHVTVASDKEIVYWELFNEVGYLSASSKLAHQKEFQVDLTHLKKGLYLIRFTRADGTTNAQKVIKK